MRAATLLAAACLLASATQALAQTPAPDSYRFPAPEKRSFVPNTAMDPILPEARKRFLQSAMAANPLSLRDMINLFAYKLEAKPGVSYDDVVAAMKHKANKLNFKFVGVNSIYKDVAAITGKPTPRVEVYNFCDAIVARELLDYSLEFVVLLPCRIAVVEDARAKVWLMTLDWDVSWLDTSPNPDSIPPSLRASAVRLRKAIDDIMQAGADGEL